MVPVEIVDAFVPCGLGLGALGVEDVGGDGGEVAGGKGGCEARVRDQRGRVGVGGFGLRAAGEGGVSA